MIKKILCPTDFSPASMNAIEYGANLSQRLNASLTLLNIQKIHISDGISLFAMKERESTKEASVTSAALKEMCIELNKSFQISCNHEIIPTISAFENVVVEESDKYNLMVIGTNGEDDMYQFYFGSHSFRISKKTVCPVFIIPETCPYREITRVAFATDYKKGDEFSLMHIREILKLYNASLQVIHVSQKDNEESIETFNAFSNIIKMEIKDYNNISFDRIVNQNVAEGIDNFVKKEKIDLLSFNMREHGFLYRAFHKNIVERLTATAEFPILIYHS